MVDKVKGASTKETRALFEQECRIMRARIWDQVARGASWALGNIALPIAEERDHLAEELAGIKAVLAAWSRCDHGCEDALLALAAKCAKETAGEREDPVL